MLSLQFFFFRASSKYEDWVWGIQVNSVEVEFLRVNFFSLSGNYSCLPSYTTPDMVVIHITTGRVLQFPEARSCFLHFSFVQCLDPRIEAKPLFQRKSLRDFNSTTATQAPPWKALQGTSAAGGQFSQVSLLSLPPHTNETLYNGLKYFREHQRESRWLGNSNGTQAGRENQRISCFGVSNQLCLWIRWAQPAADAIMLPKQS